MFVASMDAAFSPLIAGSRPDTAVDLLRVHGVVMVLLCVVPAVPSTLGNFLLPSLVGAKAMAFPWVGRAALALHFAGFALVLAATQSGATTHAGNATMVLGHAGVSVSWLVAAMTVLVLSSALDAVNVLVTMHTRRPLSVPWRALPTLSWALYGASLTSLLTAPVLCVGVLLVVGERTIGLGVLDPQLGGNPSLLPYLLWLYLHPALAGAFIAAMGVVSHVLAAHSSRPVHGSMGPVFVLLAIASAFGWGQHVYAAAISGLVVVEMSFGALLFQVPLVFLMTRWLAALRAPIALRTPMLYALAFIAHFAVAAPTGLMLALPNLGPYLGASTFAIGHLHYLAAGGVVFALLAGLHHVWPTLTGRLYDERHSKVAFIALLAGTELAFFPMLILGSRGVPRSALGASRAMEGWQIVSSLGVVLTVVALLAAFGILLAAMVRGERVTHRSAVSGNSPEPSASELVAGLRP
jgi:cytochrome c oxidase subunit 1